MILATFLPQPLLPPGRYALAAGAALAILLLAIPVHALLRKLFGPDTVAIVGFFVLLCLLVGLFGLLA